MGRSNFDRGKNLAATRKRKDEKKKEGGKSSWGEKGGDTV